MELETLTHHKRSRQNAQALVEFSLILPILLFITIGIIEFGRAFFSYVQVTNLHRVALRLASTVGTSGQTYLDCTRMIDTIEQGVFFGTAEATVYYLDYEDWDGDEFTATVPSDGSCDATGEVGPAELANGDLLAIDVDYTLDFMTPLFTQTFSFDLYGQRTVVRTIDLTGVPFCGDLICNGDETGDPLDADYCDDCLVGSGSAPSITSINYADDDPVTGDMVVLILNATDPDQSYTTLSATVIIGGVGAPIPMTYDATIPSGYKYTFDSEVYPHGSSLTLDFQVKDDEDNSSPQTRVTVVINNPPIDTVPTVSISAPPASSTVSGSYLVQVTASDGQTATTDLDVDFWVDGSEEISNLTYNPGSGYFEASWDTTGASDGPHSLEAKVSDGVNPVETSASVAMSVDNSSPPGAAYPVISVVTPSDGATGLTGIVPIEVTVSDADPLGSLTVEVNIDSGGWSEYADLLYDGVGGFYYLDDGGVQGWDTTGTPNGQHTIQIRVEDSNNNITYEPTHFVTVANPIDVHVFSLSDAPVNTLPTWATTITITIVDQNDAPVQDVLVNGTWSGGYAAPGSCTTNGSGQCSVSASNIVEGAASVSFTVVQLSKSGVGYDSGANVVTSITSSNPP